MSATNEWTEWHLTPRGWERGSERQDFGGIKTVISPKDRVLTVRWVEYQAEARAKAQLYHEKIWEHEDEELIEKYKNTYGDPPNNL